MLEGRMMAEGHGANLSTTVLEITQRFGKMIGFVTRSVIAITVGTLFLIAMLIGLAADFLASDERRSSKTLQQQAQRTWNRSALAQSQAVSMEEMQS
jgi:hypothetical protein